MVLSNLPNAKSTPLTVSGFEGFLGCFFAPLLLSKDILNRAWNDLRLTSSDSGAAKYPNYLQLPPTAPTSPTRMLTIDR